jgi:uncharacterized MAPEG superfamily protein
MQAMQIIQKMPAFVRTPLMKGAMSAMQNPPEAIRRAALAFLPINVVILFFPHVIKAVILAKDKKYDFKDPRGKRQQERQARHPWSGLISRMQAAHSNSLETFPLFGIALLACVGRQTMAKGMNIAEPMQMLRLSGQYTIGRMLYILFYAFSSNPIAGGLRSLSFFHNYYVILRLMVMSITAPLAAARVK